MLRESENQLKVLSYFISALRKYGESLGEILMQIFWGEVFCAVYLK